MKKEDKKLTSKEQALLLQADMIQHREAPLYWLYLVNSKTLKVHTFKMLNKTILDCNGEEHQVVGELKGNTIHYKRSYLVRNRGKEGVRLLREWEKELQKKEQREKKG